MENNGVKNGLFMGVAMILFSMVLYFINPKMMLGTVGLLGFLIPLYFMWKSAKDEKYVNGGYLSFGEGIKVTFLSIAVGFLISSIFSFILIKYVDPGLIEIQGEVAKESAEKWVKWLGAPEDAIEKMRDDLDEQDFTPKISSSIMTYSFLLIIGFLFCLIISAIAKKDDPSNV